MRALVPAPDVTAAAWVVRGLRGFAESVLSVVPDGFPAYVRIFHPAIRYENGVPVQVPWREVAAIQGTQVHPAMQMPALSRRDALLNEPPPSGIDQWPDDGSLDKELMAPLAAVLGRHTATSGRCWFAVWEGWAAVQDDELIQAGPKFGVPHRNYHLLSGPLEAAASRVLGDGYGYWSAQLIWPDDHAWCLATEVDFNSTYLGCSEACRDEVLALPGLEAFAIDPRCGVTADSDTVNLCT